MAKPVCCVATLSSANRSIFDPSPAKAARTSRMLPSSPSTRLLEGKNNSHQSDRAVVIVTIERKTMSDEMTRQRALIPLGGLRKNEREVDLVADVVHDTNSL